ncbi:unnamed protein product, partial [Hapterophycus canaliculatus]
MHTATDTVSARYISSKELMVETPPCPLGPRSSAFFFVEVSSNGMDFPHNPNGPLYFYDATGLFVELLSPKIMRESGGMELTVRGFGFPETFPSTLACVFGGGDDKTTVPATRYSMELMTCISPSRRPGPVVVTVTSYGQAIPSDGDLLVEYVSDVQIFSSWPTFGPASGGTAVTILGQDFREEQTYACAFGSLHSPPAEAVLLNNSALLCHAPMALGGETVALQVLTVHDNPILPSSYVYRLARTGALTDAAPTTAAPSNGPASGGTVVRVLGSGFLDLPQVACRFGVAEPTPATVISSGTLVCTTSSLAASAGSRAQKGVELRVAMNGVDFAPINTSIYFMYDDDIAVVALIPDRGPATGGVRVVVRGSGFRPDERLACRFGMQEVVAEYIRGDAIACLSPAQVRVSLVSVSVTLNGQDFYSGKQRAPTASMTAGENRELGVVLFTYTDRAAVTGLMPDGGPTRGGTVVTVSGVNFADSSMLLCRFGDLVTTAAVFVSTEMVSCVSPAVPAGAAGRVYLEVSDLEPGDDAALWTNSRVEFTFTEDPVVLAAFPASGPSKGGTRVSLTGFGFQDLSELGCRFGATAVDVPATFLSPTEVVCIAPEQLLEWNNERDLGADLSSPAGGATVRVAATLNGQDYGLRMAQFVYYPTPEVFSVSPDRGPSAGGTMVKVSGVNLTSAGAYPGFTNGSLLCRFG